MAKRLRIGIDTGGTFTDLAVLGRDSIGIHKLPSTTDDPARAVLDGLATVRSADAEVDVVHGTTVGLNAMLTGRFARTALITNEGFVDLVEVGRQQRDSIYALSATKAEFPVPRSLRFGVASRRTSEGRVTVQPTAADLRALCARVRRARVDSIAIGLLHSYLDPACEHRIARALAPLGVPITCSADLLPQPGEFERFTAAVINACVEPIVASYLRRLDAGIGRGRLRLMRSSGGVMSSAEAHEFPARAMLSGPAGGVIASRALASALGEPRAATLDMGGTSTDVGLVGDCVRSADAMSVRGLPLAAPSVDMHTIGCGGGSIAYADAGGALRVGPQSAGADPGPACYGQGSEPTVTDAHVVLGHIGASTLLGGDFAIEPERSRDAVDELGKRLGLTRERCARGILEVAEIAMVRALLVMTVERRIDPASVPLIAFGGAGGLHAASLADRLGMRYAIVPDHPGAFSAVGLSLAGDSHESSCAVLTRLDHLSAADLRDLVRSTRAAARAGIAGRCDVETALRLRFDGQGNSLRLDAGPRLADRFRALHERQFGFVPEGRPIELVAVEARASTPSTALPTPPRHRGRRRRVKPIGRRASRPVFARDQLDVGSVVTGPAVVEELTSAVVIPKNWRGLRIRHGLKLERS